MFSDRDLLFRLPDDHPPEGTGNFARRVLVLFRKDPDSPQGKLFLYKILQAVQMDPERDALFVDIEPSMPFSMTHLLQLKHPEHVLVFGLPPSQGGLYTEIPAYQPFDFLNTSFLFADAPSTLEPDKNLKGRLWSALKILFAGP